MQRELPHNNTYTTQECFLRACFKVFHTKASYCDQYFEVHYSKN